ncbi:MAG: flagellar basal-body MS-ring/collar protein FliF [Dissulfurimicrobium sp.]|uniref:flagellar basal-body MS-ring/collar protein FliF n=1 Tax=Dissulfurimicrobium sp. TaxID=2022436 RepID=UPI0040497C31
MATPQEALQQIKRLSQSLSLRQKIIAASVVALAFAGFGLIFFFANRPVFKPLYTDLSSQDAADIVAWLKKESIPYQIYNDGTAIRVPKEKIYDIRLSLAGAGLPKEGGVGFEIFDKTNLEATDFVQHVNFQRALQGELEKTISRFPQVRSVKVLLAQPQESLFVSERKEPTASVVLQMKTGQELSQNQIRGIVHLVASAVPRLKKENVSVVDTSGGVLYDNNKEQGNDLSTMTNAQLAYQKKLEDYYRHKIQSMLEDVLGPNQAVVRVNSDVDFDQVQTSEDRYDPDQTAVRSEQKINEIDMLQENTGGVAGVKGGLADKLQGNTANIPNAANPILRQKTQDISNYEITRIQKQVNASVGKLKRLSVGVMVDGSYKSNGKELVYIPRSQEEMANLDHIVKAAIGFNAERGDEVSVVNVPFKAQTAEEKAPSKLLEMASSFAMPLINLILAILFIFIVLRPLLNRYVLGSGGKIDKERPLPEAPTGEKETQPGEENLEFPPPPVIHPLPDARDRLREIASAYPERAAALVKIWLREKPEAGGAKNA